MKPARIALPTLLLSLLFSSGLLALAALAGEGAREISQACAGTGCFPGDAPGFPVTITQVGS